MINSEHYTFAILCMAMITFVVRYAFFSTTIKINLSPQLKNILTFTAPCVLTAMFIPIMFQHLIGSSGYDKADSSNIGALLNALLNSSYFWASLFAIISSLLIRQTLLVIIVSVAVFYGLRYVGLN